MSKDIDYLKFDADTVLLELNEKWKFTLPFGWIPITDAQPDQMTEIYQAVEFDSIVNELIHILKTVFEIDVIYEISEDQIVTLKKLEACNFCYTGLEHFYSDPEYQFAIYFSHESSVTVGGEKLIAETRKIWPDYHNHFWIPWSE